MSALLERFGNGRATVKAGEVYSADSKRGRRFARVEQVRGLSTPGVQPYLICREVTLSAEGGALHWKEVRGRHGGVDRSLPFNVTLTWNGAEGRYEVPRAYRLEVLK